MWSAIGSLLLAIWRFLTGRPSPGQEARAERKENRADFVAISKQWERLATQTEKQLLRTRERLDELQQALEKLQREHEECEQARATQARKIVELENRIAVLESSSK